MSYKSANGAIGDSGIPYLKPSDLYPAALLYQLAIGVNQVLSHGRLMTKLTREGCDIVVGCVCCSWLDRSVVVDASFFWNPCLAVFTNENSTGQYWTIEEGLGPGYNANAR